MIYVGNIKQQLMDILIKSGKPLDMTNRIPVKRWITTDPRRPKGYLATRYKNPDEIDEEDTPIGNFHLLPKDHPMYKPKLKVNEMREVPPEVKEQVDGFVEATFQNDHEKFYHFMHQNNIPWLRCIERPGIDFMRAKMALKEAIHFQGFSLDNPMPLADNAPSWREHYKAKQQAAPTPKPTRPKVSMVTPVSDAARKKGTLYYDTGVKKDRQQLYANLKSWGITWEEHPADPTNCMRAMHALNVAIDSGFDPFNPPADPSAPAPVDPAAVKLPDNATPRQRAIAEHINKMVDMDVIEACTRVRAVPEDNRAQEMILSRLQAALVNTISRSSAEVKERIDKEWGDGVLSRLQAAMKNDSSGKYTNNPEGFGKQMSEVAALVGCKRNVIQEGYQTLAASFNMAVLTDPYSTLSTVLQNGSMGQNGGTQVSTLIQLLNEGYSNHTTDSYEGYQSNLGYSGYDPDVYMMRYNDDRGTHDGFCLYLDKIADQNPETKPVVDGMKQKYRALMNTCEGNPNLMNAVLSSTTWSDVPDPDYRPSSFGSLPLTSRPQAVAAAHTMDKTYNVIVTELRNRGYNNNDILNALRDTVHNDNLEEFHIANDVINFREVKAPNNKPFLKKAECAWGSNALLCAQAKFAGEINGDPDLEINPPPVGTEEAWGYYKAAKQMANFSAEQYVQAHKQSHELFGMALTKAKQPLDYSTLDTSQPWKSQGITQVAVAPDPIHNLVMTNLIMGQLHHSINTSIAQVVDRNTESMTNNSGIDYAGNFSYYSGTLMSPPSDKRFTQIGNALGNGATYTAAQLSDKIVAQTTNTPNYSAEYLNKVRDFYAARKTPPVGESFAKYYNKGMEPILESPIKDILYSVTKDIGVNTPSTADKPRFATTQMFKRLNYVPFDFEHPQGKQPRYLTPKDTPAPPPPDPTALQTARQKLFESATCSIKTEDRETSLKLQAQMAGPGFDYKDANTLAMGEREERNPNMNAPRKPLHSGPAVGATRNRVLVFNSPFFQINNSLDEESFNENHTALMNNGVETLASKPLELYQGLTYSAAAGMLKQDEDINSDTEAALGKGKFFSYKAGHAAEFVGNQHIRAAKSNPVVATRNTYNGMMGMATVMRGPETSNQGSALKNKKLSSLSGDHTSKPPLPDYELCIKQNGLAFTHHIVDVTVMNIGITAQRTDNGIIKAVSKELVAAPDGTSINMLYKEDF